MKVSCKIIIPLHSTTHPPISPGGAFTSGQCFNFLAKNSQISTFKKGQLLAATHTKEKRVGGWNQESSLVNIQC